MSPHVERPNRNPQQSHEALKRQTDTCDDNEAHVKRCRSTRRQEVKAWKAHK